MVTAPNYLLFFTFSVVIALVAVAGTNATVDVNGVYHERNRFADKYVDDLVHSEHGLVWVPYERLIKLKLSRRANADCYVFGSSHVMTINRERLPFLQDRCSNVVNLGVSSANFEDYAIFMSALLQKEPGTQVYVELPPWLFQESDNERWAEVSDAYEDAVAMFGLEDRRHYEGPLKRLLNLVSASYLRRNIDKLLKDGGTYSPELNIRAAWPLETLQPDDMTTAPNGALTYSQRYQASARQYADVELFKTARPVVVRKFVRDVEVIFGTLKQRGIIVVPILMPYDLAHRHCQASATCSFLEAADSVAKGVVSKVDLNLIGSYDSRQLGLSSADFYDDQHVRIESLPKLSTALH